MKSVHFKSKSNEKFPSTTVKKLKVPIRHKQKAQLFTDHFKGDSIKRPDSCPINASWAPSRNWHEILTRDSAINDVPPNVQKTCYGEKFNGQEADKNKLDDELINIVLPTVNFCCPQKENDPCEDQGPNIIDLCDVEKKKIAQLVQEIAKSKKEKQEDEEIILKLKDDIAELKTTLSTLIVGKNYSENKAVSSLKSRHSNEQGALKKQVNELNKLVYEMQVHKSTSDARLKTVLAQAERLTRAMHTLHADNTRLQLELRLAEDRLAAAQRTIDQLNKEFRGQQFQSMKHSNPRIITEDKACQSFKEIPEKDYSFIEEPTKNEQQKDSEDQHILTELFFNKSLRNDFSPKETIIFLSTGCNDQLPPVLDTVE